MTMFVNLNIVSASDSHHSITGRALLADHRRARSPKMMLKTTICSTSPSAIASMTDVGNDVQEDLIPRLRVRGDRRTRAPSAGSTADAGLQDVDRDQADEQRERRDDLEVDHRAQPHAADDLEVARAGDAGDERARRSAAR